MKIFVGALISAVALVGQAPSVAGAEDVDMTMMDNTTDPCLSFAFTSCEQCAAVGCLWCAPHGACSSVWDESCPEEDWLITCEDEGKDNFFSDPLYDAQEWVYDMLNIRPVWEQGLTGEGIMIQVTDQGVNPNLTEFSAPGKFDVNASCPYYFPLIPSLTHGIQVASIATGSADNDECAAGIAPHATLSACLFQDLTDPKFGIDGSEAFRKAQEVADVSINSWNDDACKSIVRRRRKLQDEIEICPLTNNNMTIPFNTKLCADTMKGYCFVNYETDVDFCDQYLPLWVACEYNGLTESQHEGLVGAIEEGRDGKGVVFVFAAGNEYKTGETINMEGLLNTRYTISVGAVGKDRIHASYSSTGSGALFISGPGGDEESATNHITASAAGGCQDAKYGTSFATPAVGGAIALMLQANPELGWRDVQGILASTAVKTDPDSMSWTTNAAGYHHSPFYGFGLMDASAAVEAAKTWTNYGPEMYVYNESGLINAMIGDSPESPTVEVLTLDADDFVTESVVVYVNVSHVSRGNLQILLTSPQGMITELIPPNRREFSPDVVDWELMSVRSWGEDPSGEWFLTVVDWVPGDLDVCFDTPFDFSFAVEGMGADTFHCAELVSQANICWEGTVNEEAVKEGMAMLGVEDIVDDTSGMSFRDACCACGGGDMPAMDSSEEPPKNHLVSWSLVAYGHSPVPDLDGEEPSEVEKSGP